MCYSLQSKKKQLMKSFFIVSVMFFLLMPILQVEANERVAVSSAIANIRSEPSGKGKILWKAEKYYPLVILKKDGKWYRFRDFEGDEGWIHNSIVKKLSTVITVKGCNVRSKPSTKSKVIFTAEKGIPFKVIGKKGDWLNIEHSDGDKGWIFKSMVW